MVFITLMVILSLIHHPLPELLQYLLIITTAGGRLEKTTALGAPAILHSTFGVQSGLFGMQGFVWVPHKLCYQNRTIQYNSP